ncbi:Protein N-acetyltransferase, RimJ/RimL family [Micromonospora cremea]|uniref:Protein N-acetyltransferase, RimJ/RimL family n=1 Tax=Micromonospora cremea TaxID=709881 RepID=A0A1N6BFL8_9ACTN|nr:Protein N-acetyltransferase, RimJ/RimL family [Micromonospora cremea]
MSRSMQRATDRLLLRPLRHGDEKDILAYRSRQDVCRYLTNDPLDESSVEAFVAARTSATHIAKDGDRILLAVELEGRVIGDVRFRAGKLRDRQGEVGWVFNPDFHGRGYATEAARDLVRLAFEDLGMHRVWAQLDRGKAPRPAYANAWGMPQEGHLREHSWLRGKWGDLVIYGILEDEWLRATPWPLRQAPREEVAVSHPCSQARPLTPTLPDNDGRADQEQSRPISQPRSSSNPQAVAQSNSPGTRSRSAAINPDSPASKSSPSHRTSSPPSGLPDTSTVQRPRWRSPSILTTATRPRSPSWTSNSARHSSNPIAAYSIPNTQGRAVRIWSARGRRMAGEWCEMSRGVSAARTPSAQLAGSPTLIS